MGEMINVSALILYSIKFVQRGLTELAAFEKRIQYVARDHIETFPVADRHVPSLNVGNSVWSKT
jgi:hypothetical protein